MISFDADFVAHWSDRYVTEEMRDGRELRLLEQVGPAIATRGYLTRDELGEIGRWKSRRSTGYLARNTPSEVEDISRLALTDATPGWLRHRVLSMLIGVHAPMASAVLTVWRPSDQTVLDYRAVEALQELATRGVLGSDPPRGGRGNLPGYWTYLQAYGPIADHLGVSFRSLDRALWKWHKVGMPETWLANSDRR